MGVSDNYRPVTLSPIVSKIFAYCVLHKFEAVFESDSLQFGFKKKNSAALMHYLRCHKLPIILLIVEVLST